MAEIIHRDTHDWAWGPRWEVTKAPTMAARRDLVRFVKRNAQRKLLDQIAHWDGDGWSPQRWVPLYPQVPRMLIEIVERHMRGLAA